MGITSGFGAASTAAEVVAGLDLHGRTAVVTGGASGIGVETVRALAAAGAAVTVAARDLAAAERAVADVAASTGSTTVRAAHLDLTDLASVDAFAAAWRGPLHVLVANAGVMDTPQTYTPEGWELQFATNHLGHMALTLGLREALAAAGGDARVVVVSSSGHGSSPVVFDDLFFTRRPYDPGLAYGQSKTANVLFAVELTRRWRDEGVTANALMPGGVWTNLQRHWDPDVLADLQRRFPTKTPEQGAATSVLLATSPALAGVGGRYFENCHEAEVVPEIVDGVHGVLRHALDPEAARRLWDVSLALIDAAPRGPHRYGGRTVACGDVGDESLAVEGHRAPAAVDGQQPGARELAQGGVQRLAGDAEPLGEERLRTVEADVVGDVRLVEQQGRDALGDRARGRRWRRSAGRRS